MTYYLKRNGKYLTKDNRWVSDVELNYAWGFDMYVTASQTAMKFGGDFEITSALHVFMAFLKKNHPTIDLLKEGLEEHRQKIREQDIQIIQLRAANESLLNRLKSEYEKKKVLDS